MPPGPPSLRDRGLTSHRGKRKQCLRVGIDTFDSRIVRAELVWDPFGDLEPFDPYRVDSSFGQPVLILLKLLAKALQSVGAKADQREGGTQTSSCAQEECALLCGNSLTLFSLLTFQWSFPLIHWCSIIGEGAGSDEEEDDDEAEGRREQTCAIMRVFVQLRKCKAQLFFFSK